MTATLTPAKAERRRQILDAAFDEFSTQGYAGASMAAIARRASASKETLYAWFESKETLFNTLLESRLDGLSRRIVAEADGDQSASHLLPIIAEDLIRFLLASAPLIQALGVGAPGEAMLRRIGEIILQERQRFADYLLRCRDRGEIGFDDDPLELVSLFVAMAEGEWIFRLATGQIDQVSDLMIAQHAERVTRIFLKGLAP